MKRRDFLAASTAMLAFPAMVNGAGTKTDDQEPARVRIVTYPLCGKRAERHAPALGTAVGLALAALVHGQGPHPDDAGTKITLSEASNILGNIRRVGAPEQLLSTAARVCKNFAQHDTVQTMVGAYERVFSYVWEPLDRTAAVRRIEYTFLRPTYRASNATVRRMGFGQPFASLNVQIASACQVAQGCPWFADVREDFERLLKCSEIAADACGCYGSFGTCYLYKSLHYGLRKYNFDSTGSARRALMDIHDHFARTEQPPRIISAPARA